MGTMETVQAPHPDTLARQIHIQTPADRLAAVIEPAHRPDPLWIAFYSVEVITGAKTLAAIRKTRQQNR